MPAVACGGGRGFRAWCSPGRCSRWVGCERRAAGGGSGHDHAADGNRQPRLDVLIPNFERVYPNITVDVTYAASTTDLYQLETTELAAGNGPDLISTFPGCGLPVSGLHAREGGLPRSDAQGAMGEAVAAAHHLALDKYGQGLFAFEPTLSAVRDVDERRPVREARAEGSATFSQLLAVCRKAKAAGTVPLLVPGLNATRGSRCS